MRILSQGAFIAEKHSSTNMLINNQLIDPVDLSKNLTWMFGKDTTSFPLSMMTEGNGFLKSVKPTVMNDTQYKWNIIGRMKRTSMCKGLSGVNATPGLYTTPIKVIFEDKTFIKSYTLTSPDNLFQFYLMNDGNRLGANSYEYLLMPMNLKEGESVDLSNFTEGLYWVMGAPIIAAAKSDGTRSNSYTPGKLTNQFGYHRYSKGITGNIANKVLNIELDAIDENNKSTKVNSWIPFEMAIFERERRFLNENDLWVSKYNRDNNGKIMLQDPDTGEDIPRGAGVFEQIDSVGNSDSYATLTLKKFDNTINAIYSNRDDDGPTEIILYTGRGGAREFHNAVMTDAIAHQYFTPLGDTQIGTANGFLEYGAYFNRYKTIDGKIITVQVTSYFDKGPVAQMQLQNGDTIDGLARESFTMVFLDHSVAEDGERNVQLVAEAGREYQVGIYKGMTPLPKEWGLSNDIRISDRKDVAYYEVIDSSGIAIKNVSTCFYLKKEL